jgi:hypothetical protein
VSVKTFNIKELFRFAGCVVGKVLVEKVGVQVAMLRDGRCKPRCPDCRVTLKEVRAGKIAVYDLPLADRNTVWVTLPAVQGRCPQSRGAARNAGCSSLPGRPKSIPPVTPPGG